MAAASTPPLTSSLPKMCEMWIPAVLSLHPASMGEVRFNP